MSRIAPYASVHEHPHGPGDARPTAYDVVTPTNDTILITGVSAGGLGIETAKALRQAGANVFITARDATKGQQVAGEIDAKLIVMDLGSLASIRAGVADFLRQSTKLNILINNAGLMFAPEGRTEDGFEVHFGTNHLGHFYLFQLLKDVLAASSTPGHASRVISVASAAHRYGRINLEDLNFDKTTYDPQAAYGQSKLANIHFANELDRRYQPHIRALSVHPGGIFTQITRFVPDLVDIDEDGDMAKTMKNPAQGAATQVWAATALELEAKGGLYLDEVAEAELAPVDVAYYLGGYSAHAFDPSTEKKLWDASLKLVGLSDV